VLRNNREMNEDREGLRVDNSIASPSTCVALTSWQRRGSRPLSSKTLAERFNLNFAPDTCKILPYFGEFGVRGVGDYPLMICATSS
jgi:hypothetical protein